LQLHVLRSQGKSRLWKKALFVLALTPKARLVCVKGLLALIPTMVQQIRSMLFAITHPKEPRKVQFLKKLYLALASKASLVCVKGLFTLAPWMSDNKQNNHICCFIIK
jgi:hypothetical protein